MITILFSNIIIMDALQEFINNNNIKFFEETVEEKKQKEKCKILKKNMNDCIKLNKYILGNYYDDKICEYTKNKYYDKCK